MFEISNIGILTAFTAGVISFLSPCVLPLVPGYVSYVAGNAIGLQEEGRSLGDRLSTLLLSTYFVLGFSTVFVALGASPTALSQIGRASCRESVGQDVYISVARVSLK